MERRFFLNGCLVEERELADDELSGAGRGAGAGQTAAFLASASPSAPSQGPLPGSAGPPPGTPEAKEQRAALVKRLETLLGSTDSGEPRALVLFDGLCRLCQGFCDFTIQRDPERRLAFAPLQSPLGRELLGGFGFPAELDSVVVYSRGQARIKSDAALEALGSLQSRWAALRHFAWLPRGLRDFGYEVVARNRYGLLGHRTVDAAEDSGLASRLLDTWTPSPSDLAHTCKS